jgi:ergothioneine biosynthesis protein EgtB
MTSITLHELAPGAAVQRFYEIRSATEQLVESLSDEDCVVQSMPDASPAKWHIAHTSWFFETFILTRFLPGYRPFHPSFRTLFNSYYNGVGDKHPRPERGLITRPGLADVRAYRHHVDERMVALLESPRADDPTLGALLDLGLNHEQQHQELILTDLKHLLSCNPLRPAYRPTWPLMKIAARNPAWIRHSGGVKEIGHQGRAAFAFDNELPRHRVFIEDFELSAYPVSNGEYLQFILDGGYQRPELWLSIGWDTVSARRWGTPMYWERIDGRWRVFSLHGPVPLDENSPVCHLSYFEADAYARWAGARLPTEAEWEIAASAVTGSIETANLATSGMFHPIPPRIERTRAEPQQIFGDVWEWTSSSYSAYPGFSPAPGAVGEYNGKFMCNQYVLRGGSCATPAGHIRASYRNFFPAETRWQFSGLRLARDLR